MKSTVTLKSFAALSFDGDRVAVGAHGTFDSERARFDTGIYDVATARSGRSAAVIAPGPVVGIDRKLPTAPQRAKGIATRLLVASDDIQVIESVVRAFSNEPCAIVRTASSAEALKHLDRLHATATVVDLDLPGEEGWNTAERLLGRQPTIPFVLLTGRTEDFSLALTIAAALVLPKPVNAGRLRHALEAAMSGAAARQEQQQTRQHEMLRYARPFHSAEPANRDCRHWGLNE